MRFGINLRGDLAELSDAELAAELDRLCEYRNTRFGTVPRLAVLRATSVTVPSGPLDADLFMLDGHIKSGSGIFGPSEGLGGPSIWSNAKSKICATKFSTAQEQER